MTLTITPASPTHAPAIAERAEEMCRFYGAGDVDPLDARVRDINDAIFSEPPAAYAALAWEGDRLVGFASYSFLWPAAGLSRSLYLKELYVVAQARGHGVGRRLMRAIFEIAVKHGCTRVECATASDNRRAHAFYRSLGFAPWIPGSKVQYRVEGVKGIQRAAQGLAVTEAWPLQPADPRLALSRRGKEMATSTNRVLYLICCGSRAAALVPELVRRVQSAGWHVRVIASPDGRKFLDIPRLERETGHPVRSEYQRPDEPDILPRADAVVAFPATFNTINKWALGITDTLALGLLCEYTGLGAPVMAVPCVGTNSGLDTHPAFPRSLSRLAGYGVHVVYDRETYSMEDAGLPGVVAEHLERIATPTADR